MTTLQAPAPAADDAPAPPPSGLARTNLWRGAGWLLLAVFLLAAMLLSLAIGPTYIPWSTVTDTITDYNGSLEHIAVRDGRIARTLLGLIVGIALGLSGALIQALTRNPLADPGILGVNAGAAFLVALAIGVLGITSIWGYIWFAFVGAIAAAVLVYAIGSRGRGGTDPIRLTLAGVAVGAVLSGITIGLILLDPATFDEMRHWNAGSIAGRPLGVSGAILPFVAAGVFLTLLISRPLNAMALGDDLAKAVGAEVTRTRVIGVIAVTLLCGAATAAAGPIGFVGLMVPHVARWIVGPEQRWILAYTFLASPILVLVSDVLGRVVLPSGELQVGIVTAFLGAPVLIVLVRRRRASGL